MSTQDPDIVELAEKIQELADQIESDRDDLKTAQNKVYTIQQAISVNQKERETRVAQLAIKLGIVKQRTNRAGVVLPQTGPLTDDQLREADATINGAVEELREERPNRSGRE